jgi:hypothetical protein
MKRLFILSILICFCFVSEAQYYFNDLLASQQTNQQYQLLKKNRIKKVVATSFENDNEMNAAFKIEQQINNDASRIVTNSTYEGSGNGFSASYYQNNRLEKNEDSSNNVFTTTIYSYNADNTIKNISSTTRDAFMESSVKEDHQWFYNDKMQPLYMLKIKGGTDTTRVELIYDDKGNVGEEVWKKRNRIAEHYYYYYNEKNQLTDIVRFNNKVRKMLPDFLYEYDADGRILQMTQIPANSSNYLLWRYTYNAQGLKTREQLFNKQKQPIGRVEYQYN